ncbi:MAG: carboxylate--amine ligase [Desulfobacteraceae bacterium]|nr:MAG: carboxylate--amine ligase [Desulfobacteraceae bacterium]
MNDLIRSAQSKGDQALSEYGAKRVLEAYGIPVTRESLVQTRDEAVTAARAIGYPVVVKACSPRLMHKSEAGAVALGIPDDATLLKTYDRITASVKPPLEGVLIQEMVHGQRELVVGLTRDPQFGPCVMLGLGGVLTEALKDMVFRVAPFDHTEALDMMDELRSKAILEQFRGQAPADRKTLSEILIAIGRIGLERAEIDEIDVNPIIIDPLGRIKAVDALFVLAG